MKKKSILMTCIVAVMALAMFVGCDNAPVYPSFPTGGYISQIGDFVEGQSFDASKFQVIATYLDGSQKVIKDASVLYTDKAPNGISSDDIVSAVVGFDYNNNQLRAEANVTAYTIDHIEVVAAEKVYQAESAADINKADLTVTAYYYNEKNEMAKMVLAGSEYDVDALTKDPNADKTASEVSATLAVSTELGGKANAETVVTITQVPEVIGNVVSVDSIHDIQFALAQYNYEEMPEIDYSKVVLNVTMDETDTANTTTLRADQIEGVTLSYVDMNSKLPLDEKAGQFDLTTGTVRVGIIAEFNGKTTESAVINQYVPSITLSSYVEESKRVLVEGTDLPAINPADYKVVLDENGTKQVLTLAASDFFYADSATSEKATEATEMPAYGYGMLYVRVEYQGIYSNAITIKSVEKLPAKFTGIDATLDVSKLTTAPAKQIYDNAPEMINKSALTVIASIDDGRTLDVSGDSMNLTYYVSETEQLKAGTNGKYDLSGIDQLYVLVAWGDFADFVTVDLAEPVATGINSVSPVYSLASTSGTPMYGTSVDWKIIASAQGGVFEYDGNYRVYKNDRPAPSLPSSIEEWGKDEYKVVIDLADGTTAVSTALTAPATVLAYANVDNIDVELKDTVVALVGSKISDVVTTTALDIIEGTWTPYGEVAEPTIEVVTPDYPDAVIDEGSNTVDVTISYNAIDGTVKRETIEFTFNGVSATYVDGFKLTYPEDEGISNHTLKANTTYDLSLFEFDMSSVSMKGTDQNLKIVGWMAGRPQVTEDYQLPEGTLNKGSFTTTGWPNNEDAYSVTIFVSHTNPYTGKIAYRGYYFGNN